MTNRNLVDHDHDLEVVEHRPATTDALAGETEIQECSGCDYFRVSWVDYPTLAGFGGGR